jgi:SAM-dependent methyltransferase
MRPLTYSNVRYLASKKTVDDRALNKDVVDRLRTEVASAAATTRATLRIVEIGAGLGTMVARLVDWCVIRRAEYVLLDVDAAILAEARDRLTRWAHDKGFAAEPANDAIRIRGPDGVDLMITMIQDEIADFLQRGSASPPADLLIASAVLDLMDVPATLPGLLRLLAPDGLYWFSINYDGETVLQPEHAEDGELMRTYNLSMDQRVRYGRPAGHSRTGRRLFHQLTTAGAVVLAAGASDWVVHARDARYEADEAYFLHHIVQTIDDALQARADVDRGTLATWVALRHSQIEGGQLVYLAHQLDVVGRFVGPLEGRLVGRGLGRVSSTSGAG